MNREYQILIDTIDQIESYNPLRADLYIHLSDFVLEHPLNKPRLFRKQLSPAEIISALKAFCKISSKVCPWIEKL